jgi:hypothetical protein
MARDDGEPDINIVQFHAVVRGLILFGRHQSLARLSDFPAVDAMG